MEVTISSLVLLVAVLFFSGLFDPRRSPPDSPSRFFHASDPALNTSSLFVATITVSTGVAYLLAGGAINGIGLLAVPLAMVFGFSLLSRFYSRYVSDNFRAHSSFWAAAQSQITELTGTKSIVRHVLVLPLIMIFLLFCAFEVFVTAQFIDALSFGNSTVAGQITVAILLFGGSLLLSARGGVQAIFGKDRVRAIAVIFVALLLLGTIFNGFAGRLSGEIDSIPWYKFDISTVLTITVACIGSITTQFYSAINHHIASNVMGESKSLSAVIMRAAKLTGLFFSIAILAGVFSGVDWSAGLSTGVLQQISYVPAGFMRTIALLLAIVALVAITMSTIDSLMLSVTLQVYDGFCDPKGNADRQTKELRSVRTIMIGLFVLVASLSGIAFYVQPSIFYTLLAIASGAESLVPLVILIGVSSRSDSELKQLTNHLLWPYAAIFVLAIVSNLTLTVLRPTAVPFVSLTFFSISLLYTVSVWYVVVKPHSGGGERASEAS